MYRLIVARRIRDAWAHLQGRDFEFVLGQLAPEFEHHFAGDHALGGTRRTVASQRAWFARLFRLLPDIAFTVTDVEVGGWPWRTHATAWIDVEAKDGAATYRNRVAQHLELRWGRLTRLDNLEDTQRLAAVLEHRREAGIEEARAAPIDDGETPGGRA